MITRRSFVHLAGAGGLLVAVACKSKRTSKGTKQFDAGPAVDTTSSASPYAPPAPSGQAGELSAWIHIAENDVITFFVPEAEMGQGVHTAVAMVLTAELGADWGKVTATHAPVNPVFGRQSTGGSTSLRGGYETIRTAAATARELLVSAAAEHLQVPASECTVENSIVRWSKGDKAVSFGKVVAAASKLPKPDRPKLRDKLELSMPTRRLDSFAKVTGRAQYGLDVQVEGMLIAKVAHSPSIGGTVARVDDAGARAVPGVRDVVQLSSGVAVLADHTWAAHKGREALAVTWKEPNAGLSTSAIETRMRKALGGGAVYFEQGNVDAGKGTSIEAEYSVPYLAHAPMEPLNCTARVTADGCDIWTSTQSPTSVVDTASRITGLPPEKIQVHSQFLGGGFGRRSQTDYVEEAVEAAKKSGKTVKLIWDREDEIRGYQYRPVGLNRMRASVDPTSGKLLSWEHRIASPSIIKAMAPLEGGIDGTSVDGTVKYCPDSVRITYSDVDLPVPIWFWRSVGHSQNGFVTEGFMNEAARAAGRDPMDFRLATPIMRLDEGKLVDDVRLKQVLEMVAEKSGWGQKLAEGMGRGVAVSESFGSYTAEVVEASIENGRPRVHRVVCVLDCGQTVNPLTIQAQVESGIVYGLTAALYGKIDFEKGRVVQGNFDRYRVMRMREMPKIETHIVQSKLAHGGVGEPSTGPVAGALAGAIFALTGQPPRRLPLIS